MLLKKDSGTKFFATVSGTYQSQLKKVFAAAKINTWIKSLSHAGNS